MRRIPVVMALVLLASILAWSAPARAAQAGRKTARGTVTAVAADSVSIKVQDKEMKFSVDSKTRVEAPGAGRKTRDAKAAGQPGVKVTDVVKMGGSVEVTYNEAGGQMIAVNIRTISSAGAGSLSAATPAPAKKISTGTVKSVSASSLTVTGAGGKEMTFSIDPTTKVLGKGAGTKTNAAGGRIVLTDLVAAKDTVSVSYTEAAGAMKASEVRVTVKATR
jgi:hypothetical protein